MAEGGVPAVTKSLACQNCKGFQWLHSDKRECRWRPQAIQAAVARGEILCGIRVPTSLTDDEREFVEMGAMQLALFEVPNESAQRRAEIMALTDSELDRLVAERVMLTDLESAYSQDWNAAWQVAQRMTWPRADWMVFAGVLMRETGAYADATNAGPVVGLLAVIYNLTPRLICQAAVIATEEGQEC